MVLQTLVELWFGMRGVEISYDFPIDTFKTISRTMYSCQKGHFEVKILIFMIQKEKLLNQYIMTLYQSEQNIYMM